MAKHRERIAQHYALETKALQLAAQQARLFDHHGNRGTEVEHHLMKWLSARLGPDYAVSSGEIIDSYDTNPDIRSRQQDGIVHRNDADANRFLLPSGMRLVPIESVAAVVESKLKLTKDEFRKADDAATETLKLRLRPGKDAQVPKDRLDSSEFPRCEVGMVFPEEYESGLALSSPRLAPNRPTFAIFGLEGPKDPETLATWLAEATSINLVCCLEGGLVHRPMWQSADEFFVIQCEQALPGFAHWIDEATRAHRGATRLLRPDFTGYAMLESLPYWLDSGYEWPDGTTPGPWDTEAIERLFERRPELRRPRRL